MYKQVYAAIEGDWKKNKKNERDRESSGWVEASPSDVGGTDCTCFCECALQTCHKRWNER